MGARPAPCSRPREPTLSTFTTDLAGALPGPDWLRARRSAAAQAFGAAELPTTDEEVWRYSRIGDLDLDRFPPLGEPDVQASVPSPLSVAAAATVEVVDGAVTFVEVAPELAAAGVEIGPLADAADGASLLGAVAGTGPDQLDPFGLLNDAFASAPVLVRIPRGVVVDGPILVQHVAIADKRSTYPRLVVHCGEDAEATVVEQFASGTGPLLTVPVTELDVARAARLRYVALQDLGTGTWQIGRCVSRVGQDATFTSSAVALGGDYARLRTDCLLEGRGATGNLRAAYFGEGRQTLDFRTFQDHRAPDTTSDLLFKGAVGGHSRSVYTGLIRVRPEARGTNAFQTNRNIKLSEHAWAESVPNLEIENNDVRCSHASAVGPIDEEQRFYLESRGVPPREADRLVVSGFFADVVDELPPSCAAFVHHGIAGKLERSGV